MKNFFKALLPALLLCVVTSCASTKEYTHTVQRANLQEYMGKWYVIAARPTFLEKNAYNPAENYEWNKEKQRVDIDFTYNKGSINGPAKHIKQKGYVFNIETNAHWKISPIWPLKFDYLIIAMDPNKQWVVVGVPDQKYLWIMGRSPKMSANRLNAIKHQIVDLDYRVDNMTLMEHTL